MDEKKLMEKFYKLNWKMRRCFAWYFAGMPLAGIQSLALHYIIVESQYRDVFPKDLEELLEIKGSSVNSLINNLEKNGYLRRESISNDGRYKKLVLTEKICAVKDGIVSRVMAYMKNIFAGISEDDPAILAMALLKLSPQSPQFSASLSVSASMLSICSGSKIQSFLNAALFPEHQYLSELWV